MVRYGLAAALASLFLGGLPCVVHAAETGVGLASGSVIATTGCRDKFAMVLGDTYAVVEWVGGAAPLERDILHGEIREGARVTFTNITRHREVVGIVEAANMSLTEYLQRRPAICR